MARDINEDQLWAIVDGEWETFVMINHYWSEYTDRMAKTGRAIIRRECPSLPPATVEETLVRFFKRAGSNQKVPPEG